MPSVKQKNDDQFRNQTLPDLNGLLVMCDDGIGGPRTAARKRKDREASYCTLPPGVPGCVEEPLPSSLPPPVPLPGYGARGTVADGRASSHPRSLFRNNDLKYKAPPGKLFFAKTTDVGCFGNQSKWHYLFKGKNNTVNKKNSSI